MANIGLPIVIFLTGIIYIFFIPELPSLFKIIFKIIPIVFIILYAYLHLPEEAGLFHWLTLIGLVFCMLGDGFIEKSFVLGLGAFLIGHLFYLSGFFNAFHFSKIGMLMLIPIILYSIIIGKHVITAPQASGEITLTLPVIIYIIAISTMLWAAIMTQNVWLIIGSILFVISDSILAWNKFVSIVPFSSVFVMTTYYSAQFFIAHSFRSFLS
jgi:alkenylglycerophosphocholine hydrolase